MTRLEWPRRIGATVALVMIGGGAATVHAQGTPGSGSGALTLSASLDAPSVYVFRGIVQETDPRLTLTPAVDVGIRFGAATVNLGSWHSLQSGSSGLDGPTARLHYEEDFYATFGVGVGRGLTVGTTYRAYTSPGNMFNTVQEISVKASTPRLFSAYGEIAVEVSGARDGIDDGAGTYLELGAAPTLPLGSRLRLAVPVRLGMSVNDYYQQLDGHDTSFGFFAAGVLVAWPLTQPSRYGTWTVRGGVDVYGFGETTKTFNAGDTSKVVGTIGIALTY
jgi:Bacterial protein of unknown function (Gcw_chp)